MLFTEPTSSDTDDNYKKGMIKFGSAMYSWGEGGVRKYSGGSWSAVSIQTPYPGIVSEGLGDDVATSGTVTVADVDVDEDYANKTMLAWIAVEDASNVTNLTATCGGDAMAAAGDSPAGTTPKIYVFYMDDPSNDDDVVFTLTISSGTVNCAAGAVCVYNVDEGTTFGTSCENTDTGATTNTDTATTVARDMLLSIIAKDGDETDAMSCSSAETELHQHDNADGDITVGAAWQKCTGTSTASTWTWTNARDTEIFCIPIKPAAEVAVNHMIENGEYLFAAPDGLRILKSSDGSAWTVAGNNHRSKDYSRLIIHDGYIWGVKDADNTLYFDSDSALADFYGDPDDDTAEIDVGPGSTQVLAVESFLEKLICGREDALYTIDQDADTTAKTTLTFYEERSANNFRDMAVQGGNLYFPIQDKLYSWNGSRLTDITPDWITDSWPYTAYGRFDNFMTYDKWLFMSARTNATTYNEDILAYDGAGYHRMVTPISDGTGSITMIAYDDVNNYIWYHVDTGEASGNTTYYIPVDDDSDLPYADYPTTGTNQLETSRIHAGFRRITKSLPILAVYADNCSNSTYIDVKYKLDGADSWSDWASVKSNGVTLLELPGGRRSLEFDYIELAFNFITDDSAQTPVLEGAVLYVMLRPDLRFGYGMTVIATNYQESGMYKDTRTVVELKNALRRARNSKAPVKLISPFGEEIWGYVTAMTERAIEYEPLDTMGDTPNIAMAIDINFIETLKFEGMYSETEDWFIPKHE
jgi:hypothetical protein